VPKRPDSKDLTRLQYSLTTTNRGGLVVEIGVDLRPSLRANKSLLSLEWIPTSVGMRRRKSLPFLPKCRILQTGVTRVSPKSLCVHCSIIPCQSPIDRYGDPFYHSPFPPQIAENLKRPFFQVTRIYDKREVGSKWALGFGR